VLQPIKLSEKNISRHVYVAMHQQPVTSENDKNDERMWLVCAFSSCAVLLKVMDGTCTARVSGFVSLVLVMMIQ